MNKVIKACVALAAFAAFVVLPATASATNDPVVTHPTGTVLSVSHEKPALIQGTSIGHLNMKTAGGTTLVTCTSGLFTGNLETNTGNHVQGTITSAHVTGALAGGKCESGGGGPTEVTTKFGAGEGNGVPWCLTSGLEQTTDEFIVRGGGCTESSRSITFTLDTTNLGQCGYERTTPVSGTYTTHPTDAVLSIKGVVFKRHKGSIFCPGEGLLEMSFTLETDNGNKEPLYID